MSGPDRERIYTDAEIVELLEKAARMGLPLDKGSDLEQLAVGELDRLVSTIQ